MHPWLHEDKSATRLVFWISMGSRFSTQTASNNSASIMSTKSCRYLYSIHILIEQQIFIQLTLKTEQEEYAREQIKWTPINYFDNKVVCDLIEERRPPGFFAALNDAVATAHADSSAADSSFMQRLGNLSSQYFEPRQGQFLVKHYAGDVMYTVNGMTDKNKDQLLRDLLDLVANSASPFMHEI